MKLLVVSFFFIISLCEEWWRVWTSTADGILFLFFFFFGCSVSLVPFFLFRFNVFVRQWKKSENNSSNSHNARKQEEFSRLIVPSFKNINSLLANFMRIQYFNIEWGVIIPAKTRLMSPINCWSYLSEANSSQWLCFSVFGVLRENLRLMALWMILKWLLVQNFEFNLKLPQCTCKSRWKHCHSVC